MELPRGHRRDVVAPTRHYHDIDRREFHPLIKDLNLYSQFVSLLRQL